MTRRALGALVSAWALAAGAAGCQSVIGADAEVTAVVDEMCICEELGFLGGPESCRATIEGRLRSATEQTRGEWMKKYVAQCGTCPAVAACYYTPPTCSDGGCETAEECCGFPAAVCDATGTCVAP